MSDANTLYYDFENGGKFMNNYRFNLSGMEIEEKCIIPLIPMYFIPFRLYKKT